MADLQVEEGRDYGHFFKTWKIDLEEIFDYR